MFVLPQRFQNMAMQDANRRKIHMCCEAAILPGKLAVGPAVGMFTWQPLPDMTALRYLKALYLTAQACSVPIAKLQGWSLYTNYTCAGGDWHSLE